MLATIIIDFIELINNKEEYVSTRAEQYCPLGITIIA